MSVLRRRTSGSRRLEDRVAELESEIQRLKRQSFDSRLIPYDSLLIVPPPVLQKDKSKKKKYQSLYERFLYFIHSDDLITAFDDSNSTSRESISPTVTRGEINTVAFLNVMVIFERW